MSWSVHTKKAGVTLIIEDDYTVKDLVRYGQNLKDAGERRGGERAEAVGLVHCLPLSSCFSTSI